MKTAIYIEDGLTQVVLTPETKHEEVVLKVAEEGKHVSVKRGSFYECRGGWTRHGTDDVSLFLIVRDKAPEEMGQS